MNIRKFYTAAVLLSVLCLVQARVHSQMAQARLWSVFPSGCQAGKETEIRLNGADLDGAHSLIFSHPGIEGVPKSRGASPYAEFLDEKPGFEAGQFTVKVGAAVPPGIYEVSAVGTYGISNPRCFVVDASEEVAEEQGKNNTYASAMEVPSDCSVSGVVQGNAVRDFYRLKAAKGSRVVVDCFSSRID